MTTRLLFAALAAALMFTAPTDVLAQGWAGSEEVVDGVLQVTSPAQGMVEPAVLELEEVWRIGGLSDADEEFFGVIGDILIDDRNRIYLLDSQLAEVRVFDESGTYVTTIGREGEGPGEFRRPTGMSFLPDGRFGVIQTFPSKMVLFDDAGTPAGDFPFEPPDGEGWVALGGAARAGDELAMVYYMSQPADGAFTQTKYLARVNADGKRTAILKEDESRMDYANSLCVETEWNRFDRCWAAGEDGRVFARPEFDEYRIDVWSADGTPDRVIRREYADHPREKDDIEAIKTRWARGLARWVKNPTFEIEPAWNPVEDIYARRDGSLWVRTSRGARDLDDGVMAHFDVFDRDGRLFQEVTLKGEFDPRNDGLFFDDNYIFVVTDLVSARNAMEGDEDDEEMDEEPEPMSVICYRVDYGEIASR